MSKVTLAVLTTFVLLTVGVIGAIALARGYTFDLDNRNLLPTGILVATSDPDGAEVIINGKLQTATNNTINLTPGKYTIRIAKDGFNPWEKKVEIKKEEVYKTNAFLFPRVPDLRPLTLSGAINPTLSPDQTKIAFSVASASGEKNGIWAIDMGRSFLPAPLPSPGDFRQIYRGFSMADLSQVKFLWSPDSRQVLAYLGNNISLASPSAATDVIAKPLLIDRLNDDTDPAMQILTGQVLSSWQELATAQSLTTKRQLPLTMTDFLARAAANPRFSPDGTKVLYEATAAAILSPVINYYLPGTDPTVEARNVSPGNLYVYDSKEDKNFLVKTHVGDPSTTVITWFPSSRHLLEYSDKEIAVMEYDGTNRAVVYAGPFVDGFVTAWPNWSKIVILTSLNNTAGIGENLYSVNLR